LSEILYERSEHNAFRYCEYRENRRREDLLSYECKEITFMRLQGIVWHFKSKECFGKSVYHVTWYTIQSF